jgi:hypothetical protein
VSDLPRIEEAGRSAPNAMANDRGDVFYPDDAKEALWFAIEHQARPLSSGQFPFTQVARAVELLWPALEALDINDSTQYYLDLEREE